jgi:uncharacterized membrane protein YbaN (DUF454 family)
MTEKVKRTIWIILGFLSFSLGIIGVFIPFLPTTPFLLLSAGFFLKGSDRLYQWLINHRVFGKYIRNFREYKAIPKNTKIFAVTTLWATILASVIFFTDSFALRGLLVAIGIGVTIHILHYKTLNEK